MPALLRKLEKAHLYRWKELEVEILDPVWETGSSCVADYAGSIRRRVFWNDIKTRLITKTRQLKKHVPIIAARLRNQASSPEFWLGLSCGVATRLITKIAIFDFFSTRQELATVVSVAACALAGGAAGLTSCLVRTAYRNARRMRGQKKEAYWSPALFESALVGLCGGIIGSGAANVGVVVAQSGGFAFGVAVGGVVGVTRVAVKEYKHYQLSGKNWKKMGLHGAVLGALGGVLGAVFTEFWSAQEALAAPLPPLSGPDPCGMAPCSLPTAPLQPLPLPPSSLVPPEISHHLPKPQTHHLVHHHHHTHHHHRIRHHIHRHAAHHPLKHGLRHVKHIHHPIKLTPVEDNIVLDKPGYLRLPPELVSPQETAAAPPPAAPMPTPMPAPPPPANPCETGNCAPPCVTSQPDIHGPCADPRTPCELKVSYNAEGEATHVVLEPSIAKFHSPYYEIRHAAKAAFRTPSTQGDAVRVALIVPVADNHSLALGAMAPAPT